MALNLSKKLKNSLTSPHQMLMPIKKQIIKELLKKLKLRRISLKQELKNETDLIKREAIHDSIKIIKKQIKKGKEIMDA